MEQSLLITCGHYAKEYNAKEALEIELAANILLQNTNNELWKTIGAAAFKLHNSGVGGTVRVTPSIYTEFPLKHWKEYTEYR